jgi:hypothetical protein
LDGAEGAWGAGGTWAAAGGAAGAATTPPASSPLACARIAKIPPTIKSTAIELAAPNIKYLMPISDSVLMERS